MDPPLLSCVSADVTLWKVALAADRIDMATLFPIECVLIQRSLAAYAPALFFTAITASPLCHLHNAIAALPRPRRRLAHIAWRKSASIADEFAFRCL